MSLVKGTLSVNREVCVALVVVRLDSVWLVCLSLPSVPTCVVRSWPLVYWVCSLLSVIEMGYSLLCNVMRHSAGVLMSKLVNLSVMDNMYQKDLLLVVSFAIPIFVCMVIRSITVGGCDIDDTRTIPFGDTYLDSDGCNTWYNTTTCTLYFIVLHVLHCMLYCS